MVNYQEEAKQIANHLLQIKAIILQPNNPFTWASGWKSPIYFDNRISLSYPQIRKKITNRLINIIKNKFADIDIIAGVATAGIPQGALISDKLNLPFAYVRSKPKSHGMKNMIEGKIEKGKKVILIEDLISTGGSSIKAAEAIKDNGSDVLAILSIFTYNFQVSTTNFRKIGIRHESIFNYDDLLNVAHQKKYIEETDLYKLKNWRDNPEGWK